MMCTLLLNMCVVGLVEIAPDMYKLELFDPTYNIREYVIIRSSEASHRAEPESIRAEPDKK